MIRLIKLFVFAFVVVSCSQEKSFYVAVNGNDSNPGTREHPFATLQTALDKSADLKRNGYDGGLVIFLRKGTHYQNSTLVLCEIHSGSKGHPLIITAYPGEKAVVSGGCELNLNWQKYKSGIWQAVLDQSLEFEQLFVNGQRQVLARYPNFDAQKKPYGGTFADCISPARVKGWANPVGGYVHALHSAEWGGYHYRITAVNKNSELELEGGFQNNRQMGMHKEYRFVENILEELDARGEWFLDRKNKILYFYPPKGIDVKNAKFEIPQLDHLFELRGSEEQPLHHITIDGLHLCHTRRTFMQTREPLLRSDWAIYRGGMILLKGTKNCTISHCFFDAPGGNAIFFSKYNRDGLVTGNKISQAGASGVCFVGDPAAVRSPSFEYHEFVSFDKLDKTAGPKSNNYPANCTVHDNLMYELGTVEKQIAGVQIAMASEITVSHNSIYDLPRSGINIGDGTWGGHVIEFNDVFRTVQETGDHGSFNSWGRDRFWHPNRGELDRLTDEHPELILLDALKTNVIRNNRFRCDHGWDIDLDDGSTNYHIYNNLCLNGGLKLREGFFRTVENNIMVNNSFHPHVWFKKSEDVFQHNIMATRYADIRLDGWGREIDSNLFATKDDLVYAQKHGVDKNSRFGDPLFVDATAGDFSVQGNSPAFDIGFKNFDQTQFGVLKPNLRAEAKQPTIPVLLSRTQKNTNRKLHNILGLTVKNIENLGERSAAGLKDNKGVIVVAVSEKNDGSQNIFEVGDVIVGSEDQPVNTVNDLIKLIQANNWKGQVHLTVIRNQAELLLLLPTK